MKNHSTAETSNSANDNDDSSNQDAAGAITTTSTTTAADSFCLLLAAGEMSCSEDESVQKTYCRDLDDIAHQFENDISSLGLLTRLSELERAAEQSRIREHEESVREKTFGSRNDASDILTRAVTLSCLGELAQMVESTRPLNRSAFIRHERPSDDDGTAEDGWFSDPSSISSSQEARRKCVRKVLGRIESDKIRDNDDDYDYDDDDDDEYRPYGKRSSEFVFNVDLSSALFTEEMAYLDDDDRCKRYDDDDDDDDANQPPSHSPPNHDDAAKTIAADDANNDEISDAINHFSPDIRDEETAIGTDKDTAKPAIKPLAHLAAATTSSTNKFVEIKDRAPCSVATYSNLLRHRSDFTSSSYPLDKDLEVRCSTCREVIGPRLRCDEEPVSHYCGQLHRELDRNGLRSAEQNWFAQPTNGANQSEPQHVQIDSYRQQQQQETALLLRQLQFLEDKKKSTVSRIEDTIQVLNDRSVFLANCSSLRNRVSRISIDVWNQMHGERSLSDDPGSDESLRRLSTSPKADSLTPPPRNNISSISLTLSKSNGQMFCEVGSGAQREKDWGGSSDASIAQSQDAVTENGSNVSSELVNSACITILNREIELTKASIHRLEHQIILLQDCLSAINSSSDQIDVDLVYKKIRLLDDSRKRFEDLEFNLVELQTRFDSGNNGRGILYNGQQRSSVPPVRRNGDSDDSQFCFCSNLINELSNEHSNLVAIERRIKYLNKCISRCAQNPNHRSLGLPSPSSIIGCDDNRQQVVDCSGWSHSSQPTSSCCHQLQQQPDNSPSPPPPQALNVCGGGVGPPASAADSTVETATAACPGGEFSNLIRPMPVDMFRKSSSSFYNDSSSTQNHQNQQTPRTYKASGSNLTSPDPTSMMTTNTDSAAARNRLKQIADSVKTSFCGNLSNDLNLKFMDETLSRSPSSIQKIERSTPHSRDKAAAQWSPTTTNNNNHHHPTRLTPSTVATFLIPSSAPSAIASCQPRFCRCCCSSSAISHHHPEAGGSYDPNHRCSCSSTSSSPPSSSSSISTRGSSRVNHHHYKPASTAPNNPSCVITSCCTLTTGASNGGYCHNHSTAAELTGGGTVQFRSSKSRKQDRPLTRYLPIPANTEHFDLRAHIENAGHFIERSGGTYPCMEVNDSVCRGYLMKMGQKFRTWHKRWFVFDRNHRSLSYYTHECSANKNHQPKGIIPFKSICEVYVDHLDTAKSPYSRSTFVVKTSSRPYYLAAATIEAMRIWVDVVITGAEGHFEYTHHQQHRHHIQQQQQQQQLQYNNTNFTRN